MFMHRESAAVLLAASAILAACSERREAARDTTAAMPADSTPPAEAVERARSAANALGRDLQGKLFAALDSGGPASAITFCADSAQEWTARHAREGVYVRRVSLRVRNPRNEPDAAERRELLRLDSLHRAGQLPAEVIRTVRTTGGELNVEYLRPIFVQERCLACHGERDTMLPQVRSMIERRYPSDQATGYRSGDLRGVLSVRVPLQPVQPGGGAR